LTNALAWCLATCPDADLRDGAEAVRLAEAACSATEQKVAELLDTLAAAYAEAGRFEDAVKAARQAIKLAEERQQQVDITGFKDRLSLYEAKKPYHEKN
jgi:2-methylcitrate dehydratase PrpD